MIDLTIAHSPDPDDVFMWWPLTGMVDPADPSRVLSAAELDCGPFRFRSLPADIAVLNRRAIEVGDLDITALSIFTYAHVSDRYILTACGSSMGEGYGPKLVLNAALASSVGADVGDGAWEVGVRALLDRASVRIAVPGVKTTAFARLCGLMGWSGPADWAERIVERPFDTILDSVASRERLADGSTIEAGVLIHQSQLTYGQHGVVQCVDFGAVWLQETGLPLPLGGNALRRDLDERHGGGTLARLNDLLDRSVRHALEHRARSVEYAGRYDPSLSLKQVDAYIDLYVTRLTLDMGAQGLSAIERLIDDAAHRGLCPELRTGVSHVLRA